MGKLMTIIGIVVVFLALWFGIAALLALPVMWIVNYVLSEPALIAIFGGPIGFWKAFWLIFVCGILFKSGASITKSD